MSRENIVYIDADLEDLIPDYLENRHEDVFAIKKLLDEGELDEIRRIGHSMKGSGGGYGFHKITEIGKRIEEAALSHNASEIERTNEILKEYLATVKVVLQEEEG